jgi:two-component system, cell cycle sensor histidine kinase and response regulator CckA
VTSSATPRTTPKTILVVEDADRLRDLTRRLLEQMGHSVVTAANAQEARAAFAREAIDLVLTDVIMPGGSGPELVRELQAQRPSLQAIYMSGYTDEAIGHHGVLDPGIIFLQKPFSSDALARKIRDASVAKE